MKPKAKKLVHGMGNNDADYAVQKWETIGCAEGKRKQKLVWVCPYYSRWKDMLRRCYSTKLHERYPTYIGCTVLDNWLTFSNFKAWMEKQDWEGNQLDKDILFEGNKIYSTETCVFVTPLVNSFTPDCRAARGEFMTGVTWDKKAAIQTDQRVAKALVDRYSKS